MHMHLSDAVKINVNFSYLLTYMYLTYLTVQYEKRTMSGQAEVGMLSTSLESLCWGYVEVLFTNVKTSDFCNSIS